MSTDTSAEESARTGRAERRDRSSQPGGAGGGGTARPRGGAAGIARRRGSRSRDRRDPVELLEEQAATRVPELVPIRYGRMLTSPFAFYRGAAAADGRRSRRHAHGPA